MSDLTNLVNRLNRLIVEQIEPNTEVLEKFVQQTTEIELDSGDILMSLLRFQQSNQEQFDQLFANFEDDAGVILTYLQEYRQIRDQMDQTASEYQTALDMIEEGGGKPLGNYGQVTELTQYYEYVYDLGTPYKPKAGTPLPYTLDPTTYPTAGDDPNLVVFPEVTIARLKKTYTDLIGPGTVIELGGEEGLEVGNVVSTDTTHVRVNTGSGLEIMAVQNTHNGGTINAITPTTITIDSVDYALTNWVMNLVNT